MLNQSRLHAEFNWPLPDFCPVTKSQTFAVTLDNSILRKSVLLKKKKKGKKQKPFLLVESRHLARLFPFLNNLSKVVSSFLKC